MLLVKQISVKQADSKSLHRQVRWCKTISQMHSGGKNNALDKESAQLGQNDSHPSWRLSTKPQRRRWCHSPKT